MIFRLSRLALPAVLGAALLASSASAQGRGMRGSARAPRAGFSFGLGARGGRQHFSGSAFLPAPYYYDDYDSADYEPAPPEARPVQILVEGSTQPVAPAAVPAESLLLEYRDGQWMRIPTGGQLPVQPVQTSSTPAPSPGSSATNREEAAQRSPALPPAVLVFRDGHREEVARYTILGDMIYASTDRWSTGSWTRKIAVAELDVPATLKLNEERGGKFGLPSRPSEIMVRF